MFENKITSDNLSSGIHFDFEKSYKKLKSIFLDSFFDIHPQQVKSNINLCQKYAPSHFRLQKYLSSW